MIRIRFVLLFVLAAFAVNGWAQCRATSNTLNGAQVFAATAPSNSQVYSFADRGAVTFDTAGEGGTVDVGYARLQPNTGSTVPAAYLTFQFHQNNTLVGQASVPAARPIQSGRIYAEVDGPVNTGVAIANPNSTDAVINFYFTDDEGQNYGNGSFTIGANGQIARFLNEAPFNASGAVHGTMTFSSSVPVGVIALRGYTNERSEFLITTLPVSDLSASQSGTLYMPHFADGGGWRTQVVLVNPTDGTMSGTVQFFSQGNGGAGSPLTLSVQGQVGSTFPYTIPPRSSVNLATSGSGQSIVVGSVHVTASGGGAPSGLAIFSYRNNGVTVSEAGVPALSASTAFRMYDIECGDYPGQIQTGVAIANPSASPAVVNLELTDLNGAATGMSATVTVPANGQVSKFMKELIPSIPYPFHGVLRITTASGAGVAVVGLRGDYNSRGDFLITTARPSNENAPATAAEMVFPHLVDGGGYTTEFVLFSGVAGQSADGVVRFFSQAGQSMALSFQ